MRTMPSFNIPHTERACCSENGRLVVAEKKQTGKFYGKTSTPCELKYHLHSINTPVFSVVRLPAPGEVYYINLFPYLWIDFLR